MRSAGLLVVGVVHDDKMNIHVSRLNDNAPVRDAAITWYCAADMPPRRNRRQLFTADQGSALPGAAAVEFQINQAGAHENLKGTLDIATSAGQADDKKQCPAAMVVGAEFRGVFRLPVAVFAAAQGRANLKTLHRQHQKLKFLDAGDVVERKGEIDVQHVAQP